MLALLLAVLLQDSTEYRTRHGCTFRIPAGWTVVDARTREEALKALREAMPGIRGFDFNKIDVLAIGADGASVNVNTVAGEMPMTEDSRRRMLEEIPKALSGQGLKVEKLQARLETLGEGTSALVFEYETDVMGRYRQVQAHVPGGGRTAILTCSAPPEVFAAAEPAFRSILASVRVPARRSADSGGIGSVALRGGIIGGIVGGLFALLRVFRRKEKPAPPSEGAGA